MTQGTIVTSGASYGMGPVDDTVIVKKTVGSATLVTLPTLPPSWMVYTIKDGRGDASVNPITIQPLMGTIDGATNLVINSNFGSVSLLWDTVRWSSVGVGATTNTGGGGATIGTTSGTARDAAAAIAAEQAAQNAANASSAAVAALSSSLGTKNAAGGYPGLDGTTGKIAIAQLPVVDLSTLTAAVAGSINGSYLLDVQTDAGAPVKMTLSQLLTWIRAQP